MLRQADRSAVFTMINDEAVAKRVAMIHVENKKLREECKHLRAAFKNLTVPGPEATATQGDVAVLLPGVPVLTPCLMEGLRRGLDADRLDELGLSVTEDGAIIDRHSDVLFPKPFANAIRVVLGEERS